VPLANSQDWGGSLASGGLLGWGDGGRRSPEHLAPLIRCHPDSGTLRIGAFVQRKLARLPIRHEESRTIMRRIAWDYDRLAKLAEERLADQERRAIEPKT